jgi:hypothetical protein
MNQVRAWGTWQYKCRNLHWTLHQPNCLVSNARDAAQPQGVFIANTLIDKAYARSLSGTQRTLLGVFGGFTVDRAQGKHVRTAAGLIALYCVLCSGCYMMDNADEYWAEGCQSWFDATVRSDVNSGINTRQKLKAHDPQFAALLTEVGETLGMTRFCMWDTKRVCASPVVHAWAVTPCVVLSTPSGCCQYRCAGLCSQLCQQTHVETELCLD